MPRAEAGTPKAIANAQKSKGLQKLRWYCQVCEKQCRDENGMKCHMESEGHLRQILVVGESAGKHINNYSTQFQNDFVALLSRRWGTKRVRINQVYQEYIQAKDHLHMNSTRWVTLTEFCKYLGKSGIAVVDETEKGWFISWIDNSPKALAKAQAEGKRAKGDRDEETRERKLIQEQIERARLEGERRRKEREAAEQQQQQGNGNAEASTSSSSAAAAVAEGDAPPLPDGPPPAPLSFEGGAKLSLSLPSASTSSSASAADTPAAAAPVAFSFGAKPAITSSSSSATTTTSKPGFSLKPNPLLKKVNPLAAKAAKKDTATAGAGAGGTEERKRPMSAMEEIIEADKAKKARMERDRKGWS